MNDRRRLEQLHVLVDRLERLPASRHRDWMLREVRSRAVDVESGDRPAPIRALDPDPAPAAPEAVEPKPVPAPRATPVRRRSAVSSARPEPLGRLAPGRVAAVVRVAAAVPEDRIDLLTEGGRLCLDDLPTDATSSPWTPSLRG